MKTTSPTRRRGPTPPSVILPTFDGGGTHVNLSGVVLAKNAPNKANAMKLIEWLAGDKAQHMYADINYEYPVRAGIDDQPDHRGLRQAQCRHAADRQDRRQPQGGGQSGRQGRLRQLIDSDVPPRRHRSLSG